MLPGAAAFLAGLILIVTAHRATASLAGWLGVTAGAWFVIGPLLAPLWRSDYLATPFGDATNVSLEQIGMFLDLEQRSSCSPPSPSADSVWSALAMRRAAPTRPRRGDRAWACRHK